MHRPVVQKGVMKSEDNSFKMKDLSVFFSYIFKVKKKKKNRRLQETALNHRWHITHFKRQYSVQTDSYRDIWDRFWTCQ